MQRLVESWISAEAELHGNTLAAAIRRMNENHGTSITHSRVSEWRRGVYAPAHAVVSQMLFRALPWMLNKAGIPASGAQRLALEKLIWVAVEKDGRTVFEL